MVQKDFGFIPSNSGEVEVKTLVRSKNEVPFHIELVQAIFSILVNMPMRKEVKLELK